jgi:hypothetical protein
MPYALLPIMSLPDGTPCFLFRAYAIKLEFSGNRNESVVEFNFIAGFINLQYVIEYLLNAAR